MNKRTRNMSKIFILFALLPRLFCAVIRGTTSCSEYFAFTIDYETQKVLGRIEVISQPENDEFNIKVALNVTANSPKHLCRVELARPLRESVQALQQNKHLLYHVYFPTDAGLPTLSAIWFNNRQYCFGPGASNGSIVANIEVGHIVYSPDKEPRSKNFQPWIRNSSSYSIENPTYDSNAVCGVTSYYTDSTNSLIPNGETTLPGQWPWVVALYHLKKEKSYSSSFFYCGGSLLTNRHVITGADVMKLTRATNETIDPKLVQVVLGRYHLLEVQGEGSAIRKVASYVIHPDYEHYISTDFNMAVLTLESPVEFTPFIRPICLWSGSPTFEKVINRVGYTVGWGKDEHEQRDSQLQRMLKASIMSLSH
ncbi:PREDICTED: serine protease gd-like isoform X2 [Vollenhovia emeryi]|uniref:serine protease gd-like isoform X2 n=1 Tax=Vollenhovia emeryi TaxID=411798 RepID=UPI0005F4F45A|nr:PREDICTED: serine protease gd-like isoform X2 [Vollenhovia emeryi]